MGLFLNSLNRTTLTVQQLQTTPFVDTATSPVLDLCDDNAEARYAGRETQYRGDYGAGGPTGYGDQKLRRLVGEHDVRPLIKHRVFSPLHKAPNHDLTLTLPSRNMTETVHTAIKQKSRVFVRSCVWWTQFRELAIKCVVHNIEREGTLIQLELHVSSILTV